MIHIVVEFMDHAQEMHAYGYDVPVVPQVDSTIYIQGDRYKVIHIVHRIEQGRITLCTERIK